MRNSRLRGWVWVVWLLVPVLLVGCRRGGGARHHGSSDNSVSSGRSGGSDGPGIGDIPVPDFDSSDGGYGDYGSDSGGSGSGGSGSGGSGSSGSSSSGSSSSGSGGSTETDPVPEPDPTDPTEEAFQAVSQGSCLPIYRDGRDWNVSEPPAAVSCGSDRGGLFQVTRTLTDSTSCPSGSGRDMWTYYSSVTGTTTTLCLNRVWVKNYCVLAEQSGNDITSIGSTTAVDCDATRVPVPYDQVLVVAGVYQVPASGADTSNCPTGPGDNRRYWSIYTDDGETLVCFTAAK